MPVRSGGGAVLSAVAALCLLLVTGCGADDEADRAEAESSPTTSTATSPSSPAPSESVTPNPPTTPAGRLLAAEEVPGFNDEFTWREESTRKREGRRPFGTCHRFAMTSIGATDVAVRDYAPVRESRGTAAANLVAEFADEETAARAYEVLRSWRGQCAEMLTEHDRRKVGGLEPAGAGTWYLLVYGPAEGDPDAGYFDAQGLVRVGSTISVLEMRTVGQDYNYGRGREPMVAAVEASAAKLAQ